MNTTNSPHKILIPLLSLTLLTIPGLRAQNQGGSTNAPQGTNSCPNSGAVKKERGREERMFANLTEAEKQEIKADMKQIKDNEQLVADRQALKDAQTPEAKKEAHKALQATREKLLLKVDPAVQPILDKMKQGKHSGGAEGGSN